MTDEQHAQFMALATLSSEAFARLERHYATVGRFYVRGDLAEAKRIADQIPLVEREWEAAAAAFRSFDEQFTPSFGE